MANKIRVGLMLDDAQVFAWEYSMIERIIISDYASVNLVIFNCQVKRNIIIRFLLRIFQHKDKFLFYLFKMIDDILFKFKRVPDAFERKNASGLLGGVPAIEVSPVRSKYSDFFSKEDIQKVGSFDIDVLIRLGFRVLKGDILRLPKYGVWSLHHGDNAVYRGGPAGYWEYFNGAAEVGSILQILSEDLDNGKVLYRSYSSNAFISPSLNRNCLYWKTLLFIPRKLQELHRIGDSKFSERVEDLNAKPSFYCNSVYKEPSNLHMVRLFFGYVWRLLKFMLSRIFYIGDYWTLAYCFKKDNLSVSFCNCKRIVPPKDRFWADPHILYEGGAYYVFIEEYLYCKKKAHLSLMIMDQFGAHSVPRKIIERDYHLSNPFIFKWKEEYYIVPETADKHSIELYKCVDFPYEWEFCMNLMEHVNALDATLFYREHKWWLFANIAEIEGVSTWDELFLFYSNDLFNATWKAHPLNPIISDVKRSRPAGRIFERNGKLYRPSQNSSHRYGYGFKINEIICLSETDYEEIEVASVDPYWHRDILGTHTFNFENNLIFIDALIKRRRFL